MDTLDKGMVHVLGGTEWDVLRSHHDTQKDTKFKVYKLFVSAIFHLIFSDWS